MIRILVLDDEASIRRLLRLALELDGYEVVEAQNACEGLRCYQAEPATLVITDMQMPGMDGAALIREIRNTSSRAKIIAISGEKQRLESAKALDVQGTFQKPFGLVELRHAVRQLVAASPPSELKPYAAVALRSLQVGA
jgi:two-component system, OmpR family, KDP operon response regulator KdpE